MYVSILGIELRSLSVCILPAEQAVRRKNETLYAGLDELGYWTRKILEDPRRLEGANAEKLTDRDCTTRTLGREFLSNSVVCCRQLSYNLCTHENGHSQIFPRLVFLI